jgi:hypothetical protein
VLLERSWNVVGMNAGLLNTPFTGLKGSSGRKRTQEVKNQKDEKNGAQAYSGPSTISPTSIAVVSPASAKKQDQQNYQ